MSTWVTDYKATLSKQRSAGNVTRPPVLMSQISHVYCALVASDSLNTSLKISLLLECLQMGDSGLVPVSLFPFLSISLPSSLFFGEADLLMKLYLWQSVSPVFSIYDYIAMLEWAGGCHSGEEKYHTRKWHKLPVELNTKQCLTNRCSILHSAISV